MGSQKQTQQPPQAPEIERRVRFGTGQAIGMGIFLMIPLLAIAGLFGDSMETISGRGSDLEIQVEYPTRFRYKTVSPLVTTVRNITSSPIDSLEVRFTRSYLSGFSEVSFTPQPQRVTDTAYVVVVTDLEPGAARRIEGEVQAERYGSHSGTITASSGAGTVAVDVASFVFP